MNNETNILPFPRKNAVFTSTLRTEIGSRIKPHVNESGDVDQIINRTEDAICHWLICCVRGFAKKMGENLGVKIGEKTNSVISSISK